MRKKQVKARSSMGSISAKVSPPKRSASARGIKGGASSVQKEAVPIIQNYAAKVMKTARKYGQKGGTAALAGGAAGVIIGAAIGGIAAAAMAHNRTNKIVDTAESISKHISDLKKIASDKR
jgi:hypothetical protein